ncbi:MAG: UbiA prenyltransferase family protein [Thermoplasmatales archaeon]|nr:MAG: UbiA prenyltransferase family protein [Thermoplasmatales archaeon]
MLTSKSKGFIDLVRPFTLLAPIIVSICIMIASLIYNSNENLSSVFWFVVLPASISLALLNGASNALNQITDLETDKLSKPYRSIPRGDVKISEATIICILLYLISIVISLMINPIFFLFVSLIIIFTVTYSIPPRLKDKLYFNMVWLGIPRGLLGILASWSVFGNIIHPLPITIGIIAMVYLIGGSITKDITDAKADKLTGTKTLINTYGVRNAAMIALPFMIFPFAFIPMLIHAGFLDFQFIFLSLLVIPSFFVFYLMIRDNTNVNRLENSLSWAFMYATYFLFAFGFSILTITG